MLSTIKKIKMANEQFAELINLIINHDYYYRMSDDQRWWDQGYNEEKRMKHLLKDFVWEDVEPYVHEAHKEYVKGLF